MHRRHELPPAPVLAALLPPGAVPPALREAVSRLLRGWGHGWDELELIGTASVAPARRVVADEVWVFALAAGPLAIGDELASGAGRVAGLGVSAFRGGVIPVTPYRAQVYETLHRRGGSDEGPSERPPGPAVPVSVEPLSAGA
ncbi:hypothetical protein [Conexibacter sp. S30A1]|jgi:hypothetical protein|uniref:hypothetical protein n=1 Tax=Conexibacter sp. S30A1 TaxID=2937800 RepID=UPI00200D25CE|nr:hypothetical protein [Conexibacter sp. S30A1]